MEGGFFNNQYFTEKGSYALFGTTRPCGGKNIDSTSIPTSESLFHVAIQTGMLSRYLFPIFDSLDPLLFQTLADGGG